MAKAKTFKELDTKAKKRIAKILVICFCVALIPAVAGIIIYRINSVPTRQEKTENSPALESCVWMLSAKSVLTESGLPYGVESCKTVSFVKGNNGTYLATFTFGNGISVTGVLNSNDGEHGILHLDEEYLTLRKAGNVVRLVFGENDIVEFKSE